MVIGYTTGVFDLFHIGHLNILRAAKSMCDRLVVGVSTDKCALYKGHKPVIGYQDRAEIVRSIKYVDEVIAQHDRDKYKAWEKLHYDKLFVGDDWNFKEYEDKGIQVIYLPYTRGISSTYVKKEIKKT